MGFFTIEDKGGILTCLDADTGKPVWTKRLGGNYSASPILADGHISLCSKEGVITVFDPADEYREVATSQMTSGILASPAAAGRSLYLRTETHLYRIGKSGGTDVVGPKFSGHCRKSQESPAKLVLVDLSSDCG